MTPEQIALMAGILMNPPPAPAPIEPPEEDVEPVDDEPIEEEPIIELIT